jgi:Ca-activated chloride channel family protein
MRFFRPEMLWLILALPLMGLAGWWAASRKSSALRKLAGGADYSSRFNADISPNRRAVKIMLLYLALLALILATARPQWGTRLEPVTRKGVDIVLVLDNSLSMAAEDMAPSRLAYARHAIDSLLARLAGNRVALVTFAGQSTLACPLTLDHAAVRLFLDTVEAESMQVPGTALAEALKLAAASLNIEQQPGRERSRALILFTDGEDHEGGVDEALEELESAGIALFAVGVGSSRGSPIPVRSSGGTLRSYKKDRQGKIITTRLGEQLLESMALTTGGRYHRATATEVEVEEIAQALTGMDSHEYGSVLRARYEERFQLPLLLALLALAAETLLGDRRKQRRRPAGGAEGAS